MESNRRVTTVRQLEILVEFLREHRDLALGKVRSKEARANATRLWAEVTVALNVEGPGRTSKEWAKVWNDLKCKIRTKLVSIKANKHSIGGGLNTLSLSPLEEQMAQIMWRDVNPLKNVTQNHSYKNVENVKGEEIEHIDMHENLSSPIFLNNDSPLELEVQAPSPVPSSCGQAPSSPLSNGVHNGAMTGRERRRPRDSTLRRHVHSARSALDESRAMILQIEKLRAEAALENAQTRRIVASNLIESIRLIAESFERYSRRYD